MAWTAPKTWSVSEVVTASMLNTHIRDNLKYLKGQAGAVYLEDNLGVFDATPANDWTPANQYVTISSTANPGGSGFAVKGTRAGSDTAFAQFVGVNLAATGADKTGGYVNFNRDGAADSASVTIGTRNAGSVTEKVRVDRAGNVGINTTTPQGTLHAKNPATGGGIMFLSATAVNSTLQTLAVAGTVTQSAQFFGYDRNNTGGAVVVINNTPNILGGGQAVVNTDTVTVTLTAGGAITVQRTSGTNGTHEVQLMILYK